AARTAEVLDLVVDDALRGFAELVGRLVGDALERARGAVEPVEPVGELARALDRKRYACSKCGTGGDAGHPPERALSRPPERALPALADIVRHALSRFACDATNSGADRVAKILGHCSLLGCSLVGSPSWIGGTPLHSGVTGCERTPEAQETWGVDR